MGTVKEEKRLILPKSGVYAFWHLRHTRLTNFPSRNARGPLHLALLFSALRLCQHEADRGEVVPHLSSPCPHALVSPHAPMSTPLSFPLGRHSLTQRGIRQSSLPDLCPVARRDVLTSEARTLYLAPRSNSDASCALFQASCSPPSRLQFFPCSNHQHQKQKSGSHCPRAL